MVWVEQLRGAGGNKVCLTAGLNTNTSIYQHAMPVGSTDDLSYHKPYPLTSIREGWAHHDQKSNRGSPCQKGGQRTQVVKWKLTFVEPTGLACCLLRGLSPRSKKRPRLTVHDVSWGWPRARPARSLCKEWLHLPRRTGTGTGVAGSNAARGAAPCAGMRGCKPVQPVLSPCIGNNARPVQGLFSLPGEWLCVPHLSVRLVDTRLDPSLAETRVRSSDGTCAVLSLAAASLAC